MASIHELLRGEKKLFPVHVVRIELNVYGFLQYTFYTSRYLGHDTDRHETGCGDPSLCCVQP
jgi:hypothetical protein